MTDTEYKTDGEVFSLAGFYVIMKRSPTPYYVNVYLPTTILTVCSFIGFLFPIDSEEGRRTAWLVTIFLMLVNIGSTERERGPAVRKWAENSFFFNF